MNIGGDLSKMLQNKYKSVAHSNFRNTTAILALESGSYGQLFCSFFALVLIN